MNWAVPAMLAVSGALAILSLAHLHLWYLERKAAFALLGISWLLYTANILSMVLRMAGADSPGWTAVHHVTGLIAGVLLAAGVYDLVDRRFPRTAYWIGICIIVYSIVFSLLGINGVPRLLPGQLLLGVLSAAAGYQVLRYGAPRMAGWVLVGPLLLIRVIPIVAGVFVRGSNAIGAWMYIGLLIVDFSLIAGTFVFYFERIRTQLNERERSLRSALSSVRTLKGLLPICANCKKIRDDDGYWHKLENYVSSHTDTQFSHGLCPECEHELYGARDEKKN